MSDAANTTEASRSTTVIPLSSRPEGFPWLRVAGRELSGVTVVDLDASVVFAASDKENAAHLQRRCRVLPQPGDLRQHR